MIPTRSVRLALHSAIVLLVLLSGCRNRKTEYPGPYGSKVAEAVPLIEAAVGLNFKSPPKVQTRSKAQVREFVVKQFTTRALEFAGMEAAYKQMGLLPDTLHLRDFLVNLLEEQIVGYYDPSTKVLYIVEGSDPDVVGLTVMHELVHALQDQYISLDSIQKIEGDNDRQSAAQAVFEGQAVFDQIVAMSGGKNIAINLPGGWDRVRELIRQSQSSMPVFATAPLIIQETLIFPYLSGAEFIKTFKDRRPNQVPYNDMPVSTEQILHPTAFFGTRDAPTHIILGAPANATKVYENTLGEFETRLFLFQHVQDQNAAVRAAAGWDGDRYMLIDTPRGRGLVWATVWDSPVDAGEFRDVLGEAIEKRYGVKATSGAGTDRQYDGGGRSVAVTTAEVSGRPMVLYADVPTGASTNILRVENLRVQ